MGETGGGEGGQRECDGGEEKARVGAQVDLVGPGPPLALCSVLDPTSRSTQTHSL